ncbi:MAG: prepilin-type N-terminal cleavage/methylation domain-containing protein [Pirellulaceae bacterium]
MSQSKQIGRIASCKKRCGFSLLEITIASIISAILVLMASGVAVDVSRHMAANIVETQVAAEARLAIESFRRDFGGNSPDAQQGDRAEWRLVGRMIPNSRELRLCFDASQNATADWIAPDHVVIYTLSNGQLLRTDQVTGNTYTVARLVDDVDFTISAGEITIVIDFTAGDFSETYTFVTSDVL